MAHVPRTLAKRLKHRLLLIDRNAGAGIAHHEADTGLGARAVADKRRHRQGNLATGGKLDRIAEQVAEHLAQLAQIPSTTGASSGAYSSAKVTPWPQPLAETTR